MAQLIGMCAAMSALSPPIGLNVPKWMNPITVHSGGADFSVFTGMVVGGLAYLILGWKDVKRQVPIQQELLRDQGIA